VVNPVVWAAWRMAFSRTTRSRCEVWREDRVRVGGVAAVEVNQRVEVDAPRMTVETPLRDSEIDPFNR